MSTTTTTATAETPFLTGALAANTSFWRSYIASRPHPSEAFFQHIQTYHTTHGDPALTLAHDVGTGPGNIAERLLSYYANVIGSDLNAQALSAAPDLVSPNLVSRLRFIHSAAEDLAAHPELEHGTTDLITVSECIPLLDAPRALESFWSLLKPGGTLAIYFYGRPIFVGGAEPEVLDALYDKIATKICTFLLPFKGTPGFKFHQRGAEALVSQLDNIELDGGKWADVERWKWNGDVPLLFNSKEGYDFEFERVDRRQKGEQTHEVRDREWWADEWDADRVKAYLDSVYPGYKQKAGERYKEVEEGIEELRAKMGGKVKVSFPVVLILATKKEQV
ncbi:S-adenosyl-L-methionine-dependent methyltransferase [Echria macrotheca]|uniref:S-adenosyl-L-methionine-dependent methyltransferase n=1 Tax=Echria macrotheca TaxID=438768 RepID=A0AAJ0B6L6_9PEZI|nr:S-adenosyl-L-methionine-dependent methyltransferase [Echria macrotheca]